MQDPGVGGRILLKCVLQNRVGGHGLDRDKRWAVVNMIMNL